ncbi:MAG: transposase [Microbacteriaceae bacterium]
MEHRLVTTIGTDVSRETVSKITDEVLTWQRSPLVTFYPVISLVDIVATIRGGAYVGNRAAHFAVDLHGIRHVQGIWLVLVLLIPFAGAGLWFLFGRSSRSDRLVQKLTN